MLRRGIAIVASGVLIFSSALCGETPVPRDTEFPVELAHTVNVRNAKVGDPIEFHTLEPVLIGNDTVVPQNATILGSITEIQRRGPGWQRCLIRITIHSLRWKRGEAVLNAMVSSILRPHADELYWRFRYAPTFMEGIRVISHQRGDAYTEFFSDHKDVVLHSGVSFMLRQIEPEGNPDRELNVYSGEPRRTADKW